ncbi:MAG: pyridoxal-dependent decarboxylase, exosortase A system-associated [Gammaproteobacteria bacterium]|nr:pyridoxal-dependent decarboxylase, exosortase A system-associated [Gammaproteobacteria bacterium]
MTTLPLHAPVAGYELLGDELAVDGRTVRELAREAGQTPFYVYSRRLVDARLRQLRAQLPAGIHLHYAMKANPLPGLVRHIAPQVDGLDVASAGELAVAMTTGTRPELISFAGPGKRDAELAAALAAGIVVNVESPAELERLARLGQQAGRRPKVALRVNPDFELKSSGMRMSGGPKQFGIDAEQVPEVLRRLGALDVDFEGFHIFSGSQNLDGNAIADAETRSMALALQLAAHAPRPPRFVNLGGGFGIPYFPGDKPVNLEPVRAALEDAQAELDRAYPSAVIVVELGRYIVGEAGLYVCQVIDRKVSRGQVFLVTDGGLHHHLAASGNFGQVLRKNYPVMVATRVEGPREVASVVGPLCTPLDLLADRMELARAEPGDLVAVFQSGAYGATASPINFLSHPHPVELLV